MQHAGLQYGQGATHSHQSPPFAHAADISSNNGGNSTSSLRQFRKRDGLDGLTSSAKSSGDLLAGGGAGGVSAENIARVRPHNHYPAGPNDYYRYHHQHHQQYSEFSSAPAFAKEAISPSAPTVKYSEIAEPSPQHADHLPTPSLPQSKLKEKDYMDMCNIPQMKQQPQYSYHSEPHPHQYLPKPSPESQYYHHSHHPPQYKYTNHQYQAPKYPENDFLAQLQRLRPKMARSIMNDHIRETQNAYPNYHHQNQRYYPHLQGTAAAPAYQNAYHSMPQAGYYSSGGSSCSYSARAAPPSVSPRVRTYPELSYAPQKVSPSYAGQYQQPEYAQHYQHRRAAPPQEYYPQQIRADAPFESADTRSASSSGLRHFLENWAPEEESSAAPVPPPPPTTSSSAPATTEIATIYKERSDSEPVYVINSSDLPLENVSLVATENGQFILKNNGESSVVRLKEGEINGGERTVNLQIVDTPTSKPSDCLLATKPVVTASLASPPLLHQTTQALPLSPTPEDLQNQEKEQEQDEKEVKDMPSLLDPAEDKKQIETIKEKEKEIENSEQESLTMSEISGGVSGGDEECAAKRTQRIFSVDDIINNIGSTPPTLTSKSTPSPSLQIQDGGEGASPKPETPKNDDQEVEDESGGDEEVMQYQNAISVEDDCVILEIGGALVQLNINNVNGTKVLSVVALSESLVIDVNGNYEAERHSDSQKTESFEKEEEKGDDEEVVAVAIQQEQEEDSFEDSFLGIAEVDASEVVIGEDQSGENEEVTLDLDQLQQICDESAQSVPFNDDHAFSPTISEEFPTEKEETCELVAVKQETAQALDENSVISFESIEEEVKTTVQPQQTLNQCHNTILCEENDESEVRLVEKQVLEVVEEVKKCEKSETKPKSRKENDENISKLFSRKSGDEENVAKASSRRNSVVRAKTEREIEEAVPKLSSSRRNSDCKAKSETDNDETTPKAVSCKRNNDSKASKTEKIEVSSKSISRKSSERSKSEKETVEVKLKSDKIEETISKLPSRCKSDLKPKSEKESFEVRLKIPEKLPSSKTITDNLKPTKEETNISKPLSRKSFESKTKSEKETEENTPKQVSRRSSDTKPRNSDEKLKRKEEPNEEILSKTPKRRETEFRAKDTPVTLKKRESDEIRTAKQETSSIKAVVEDRKSSQVCTKAAKKLYEVKTKPQKLSKLEETVNKIKSLKEKTRTAFSSSESSSTISTTSANSCKKPSISILSPPCTPTTSKTKRVTWGSRESAEVDRASRRLSWEEYSNRKRRRKPSNCSSSDDSSTPTHTKIADNTVTSSNDDVIEQVEISIESAIQEKVIKTDKNSKISSPTASTTTSVNIPKLTDWEDDDDDELSRAQLVKPARVDPEPTTIKIAPIIDVNEFRIPPLLPPASSSAEDDISLQTYKNVVDSKLNSLNINIPKKVIKVKQTQQASSSSSSSIDKHLSVRLIERFLNKSSLDCDELEKVRKIIEFKRKMQREGCGNANKYEVNTNQLKMQIRKMPSEKRKRFRNLYGEEEEDDELEKQSEEGEEEDEEEEGEDDDSSSKSSERSAVDDYSVYQRDSQGVPKLIFKRKFVGFPQPFVKLERSQAADMLAKKRKLY